MKPIVFIYSVAAAVSIVGLLRFFDELQTARTEGLLGTQVVIKGELLTSGRHPIIGHQDAEVKLIEFMDYECPPCRKEWRLLKQIASKPNVALYIRHFPIRSIHDLAEDASLISLSSNRSGALNVHCQLLERPISKDVMRPVLNQVPADSLTQARKLLREDEDLAKSIGVSHTPTLFAVYNGNVFEVSDWSALINL